MAQEESSTLARWLNENVADTRTDSGPEGRLYTSVPFARVWDGVLREVARKKRWSLVHADEELGIVTVTCRTPVLRFTDDLTVWVSLDRNGFTRLDARSESRVGRGDFGVNRRRIERLLRRIDRTVAA